MNEYEIVFLIKFVYINILLIVNWNDTLGIVSYENDESIDVGKLKWMDV